MLRWQPITRRLILSVVLLLFAMGQGVWGQVALNRRAGRVELSWPAVLTNASAQPVFPEYEVQYSTDLEHWAPLGGKVRGIEGRTGVALSLSLDEQSTPIFYRVSADFGSTTANRVGEGGAEVFGYNEQLHRELAGMGFLSLVDFATN